MEHSEESNSLENVVSYSVLTFLGLLYLVIIFNLVMLSIGQ
ncbi:MAG: hypothetical protein ACW99A_23225 [Candidatus Kariarchaeaceae archaeon]